MKKALHPKEVESTFQATDAAEPTICQIMVTSCLIYNSVCHFYEQTVPGAFENLKRKRKTCQPGLHSTPVDVVLLIRINGNLYFCKVIQLNSPNWHPVRSEWIGWSEKSTYFVLALDKSRSRAFVFAFNVSVNERLLEKTADKQPVVERSTNCRWPTVLYDTIVAESDNGSVYSRSCRQLLTISESSRLCIDSSVHLTAYLAKLASIADASLNVTSLNEKQFKHQLKSCITVYVTVLAKVSLEDM
ncbi:hypothetical protein T07_9566 [Trichinella nelsoni]|uniref:Uncharacterized protein n=1 Tax=Trichinella nelsoni TaxID=6336 RepID=A0A0V0RRJ7_9BILA|nr:hypothetical protein T07_9566 [Trichinella nelsoni]